MIRVLVCGSRTWKDEAPIRRELHLLHQQHGRFVLIHGAAAGADSIAGRVGVQMGLEVQAYPAQWAIHGRAAGIIRNRLMLTDGRPERVLAFVKDYSKSKGTRNMCEQARRANLPVMVFDS